MRSPEAASARGSPGAFGALARRRPGAEAIRREARLQSLLRAGLLLLAASAALLVAGLGRLGGW